MSRLFIIIYDFFVRRRLVFFLFTGLTIGVIIWFALRIKFTEDISKVLPHNEKVDQYLEVVNQSAFADELVIFIRACRYDQLLFPRKTLLILPGNSPTLCGHPWCRPWWPISGKGPMMKP